MSQFFTLDFAIVAAYLLITLAVGIYFGRGITTMREYVIGKQERYSLFVLVATLFATLIGGGSTIGQTEKISILGLVWIGAAFGGPINKLIMVRYIAPHIGRFRKKLSVGEIMGDFYGKPGRVMTGVTGSALCVGYVGAQIGAISYLLNYFLGVNQITGILFAYGIIVTYSSFGGIRSVAATDVIQFAVLMIALPMLAYKIFWIAGGFSNVYHNIPDNLFDTFSREDFWSHVFLFIVFCFPFLNPAVMQRFLMARDAEQAYDSLRATALLQVILQILVSIIAFSVVSMGSLSDYKATLFYALEKVSGVGFKGIGIAGLFAVIMSTADSFLHASAVSFIHDTIQPLRKIPWSDKDELKWMRVATVFLGVCAIFAVILFKNILDIILVFFNFWGPTVLVPLLAGILTYRASIRTFIVAATTGVMTTLFWKVVIFQYFSVGATLPGLLANLIAFVIARRFDKPEDLHFGEDELKDPRWRKYVRLYGEAREKQAKVGWNPVGWLGGCKRATALRGACSFFSRSRYFSFT